MKSNRKPCFLSLAALILMVSLFSCNAHQEGLLKPNDPVVVRASQPLAEYTIQPGDQLDIKFFYNPELNETVTVRPDGRISLQMLDDVRAAGQTPSRLDRFLTDEYSRELQKPVITVIVKSFSAQRVYVGGEVKNEGLVELRSGMTPLQAVFDAGGFAETSAPEAAVLIRKGPENEPIPIRLDLEKAMYGSGAAASMLLLPEDVIYVPKSGIALANKFVHQYIEKLLLFRGFNVSLWYGIGRAYEE